MRVTIRYRELNNKLVPIMLDRLHNLHKQAEKLIENSANIPVNSSRPFAHLAKEKKDNSGLLFDSSFLVLYLENMFTFLIKFLDNTTANDRDSFVNNGFSLCNTQENPAPEHVNGYIQDVDMSKSFSPDSPFVKIISFNVFIYRSRTL
mgnify:CR=1 FL=1